MATARYVLITLLAIAPLAEVLSLVMAFVAKDSFALVLAGFIPRSAGFAHHLQVVGLAVQFVFHLGIAIAVYLGEAWARLILLASLALGLVSASIDLVAAPGLAPALGISYCLALGFTLTRVSAVRAFLHSQFDKRANKSPEPTR